jgi:hypothetical protein
LLPHELCGERDLCPGSWLLTLRRRWALCQFSKDKPLYQSAWLFHNANTQPLLDKAFSGFVKSMA